MEENKNERRGWRFGKKKEQEKLTGKARVIKEVREWIVALVAAVLIVLLLQNFLFSLIRVDGQSMETTLHNGERLFVNVASVKFGGVNRGDVVICHYPNRMGKFLGIVPYKLNFVKRCVAVPGDTVYRKNGVTHVVYEQDGQTVDELLDERWEKYYSGGAAGDYEAYVLGEDEYFVVGDNRYNSHDSRDWDGGTGDAPGGNDGNTENNVGPIPKSMILGRVRQVIWPLNSIRPVE